jgi:hypothetical protein
MRPGVAIAGMVSGVPATGLDPEQRAEIERLQSIGYAGGSVPDRGADTGTTMHLRGSAAPDLRFYVSGHAPGAVLIDADGRTLHQWRCTYADARAAGPAAESEFLVDEEGVTACWRRARLLPDGGVLAIFEGHGLVRLDPESRPLWSYPGACHHDLDVDPAGVIHVLTREARVVPRFHPRKPVLLDFITRLAPDGRELGRTDLLAAFENSPYASHLDNAAESGDIFHTNTVELLDGRHADRLPAFAAGNYLVSVRELGIVAVVDPEAGAVVWALSGLWLGQHQPTLLDNGNLLVFDNKGHEGRSKVVEIDPTTQEVVWEFADGPGTPLYSATCGSSQRLTNGNTLITESDNGRALEVTPDGAVVWEFRNPERTGPGGEYIAAIMDMVALPAEAVPPVLVAHAR